MTRTAHATAVIALLSVPLAWAQGNSATTLVADARRALGGDALASMTAMTMTGRSTRLGTNDSAPTEVEIAFERPDKFVRTETIPAVMGTQMTRTFGFNGAGLIDAVDQGAPPENANPNMHMFVSTPLKSAATPERAAEIARTQLTKNYQEFSRFALGFLMDTVPSYPVTFTPAGEATEPCGKTDVLTVTGPNDLSMALHVDRENHRPACITFMAKEPMAPVAMGNGMQISAATGMGVFAGGPVVTADRGAIRVAGNLSPEMQARLQELQDQQAAAAAKRRTVEYRITYGDYRSFDGMQIPTHFSRFIDGKVVEQFVIDKVKVNPRIDPAKFDVTKVGGGKP